MSIFSDYKCGALSEIEFHNACVEMNAQDRWEREHEGEQMDIQALTEAIIFNAHEIAQEIDDCEYVQKDDTESKYTQEQAKITAYDHIIELIVGRGE